MDCLLVLDPEPVPVLYLSIEVKDVNYGHPVGLTVCLWSGSGGVCA